MPWLFHENQPRVFTTLGLRHYLNSFKRVHSCMHYVARWLISMRVTFFLAKKAPTLKKKKRCFHIRMSWSKNGGAPQCIFHFANEKPRSNLDWILRFYISRQRKEPRCACFWVETRELCLLTLAGRLSLFAEYYGKGDLFQIINAFKQLISSISPHHQISVCPFFKIGQSD